MELITVILAANEFKQFRKAGSYLEIIDSSYAVTVNFYSTLGGQTDSINNGLSGLYMGLDFGGFDIKNGANAQTVTLLVLDPGESGGSRRQPGNVRVIDQAADKTRAGKQFIASLQKGADATHLSLVGINANGASVAIKRAVLTSTSGGTFVIYRSTGPGTANTSLGGMLNKYKGGAASVSQYGSGIPVAYPPTGTEVPGFEPFVTVNMAANGTYELPLTTPLVVDTTNGLGVVSNAVNKDLTFTFDFEEQ